MIREEDRKEDERAQYIQIFDRAAQSVLEGHDEEWIWLLTDVLNLSPCYSTAVYEVLKQGRWRTAKNPKAYIKTAASREAIKADKPSSTEIPLMLPRVAIDHLFEGGVTHHKRGKVRVCDDNCDRIFTDSEGRQLPTVNGKPVPESLVSLEDDEPDARLIIDWAKVGCRVGADEFEQKILQARADGWTLQQILCLAKDDRETLKLQAAYRNVDRLKPLIREAFEESDINLH